MIEKKKSSICHELTQNVSQLLQTTMLWPIMERVFEHAAETHTRWRREGSGSVPSVKDCAPKVGTSADRCYGNTFTILQYGRGILPNKWMHEFTRGEAACENQSIPECITGQPIQNLSLCFIAATIMQHVLILIATCSSPSVIAIKTNFVKMFLPVCNVLGTSDLTKTRCVNATNIESFRNCTKINGNICFIHTSIHGWVWSLWLQH